MPYLVGAFLALAAMGQIRGGCDSSNPTGYFTGVARSPQSGRFDVSLNLRCANGGYAGEIVTSLGTFGVTGGSAHSNQLHLELAIGTEAGSLDATLSRDTLRGSYRAAGDSGSVALSHIGPPRDPGWDQPTLQLTAPEWQEDLSFFTRTIESRHAQPFHATPKARFDSSVAALTRRLAQLDGDQMYVALDRLANLIGDAHTYIEIPGNAARFPFAVRRFGTEYRVVAVLPGNEQILGSRVLKIEGTPIGLAIRRLWPLTPVAENVSLRQARAEGFLGSSLILHGIGLTPTRNVVNLTLADDSGREFNAELRAVPADSAAGLTWKDAFNPPPLSSERRGEAFWYEYLPEARTIYCNFRGYDSLPARAAGLLALIRKVRPEKLVIDLRQNGGGDYELGLRYLIEPLSRAPVNRPGRLFVAIGTNTFSAGMANAAQFRARTSAILVGEEIGEKPNSYQEAREVRLPNSHLVVRYATRYYRFVARGPNVVKPDHSVAPTWVEYRAGRDPALEWILQSRDSR